MTTQEEVKLKIISSISERLIKMVKERAEQETKRLSEEQFEELSKELKKDVLREIDRLARTIRIPEDGKPGKTPIAGIDFELPKIDKKEIVREVLRRVPLPEDGKTPKAGVDFPLPKVTKEDEERIINELVKKVDIEKIVKEVLKRIPKQSGKKGIHRGGVGDPPTFTTIELGGTTDTTLSRSSAGVLAVEGNAVYMASGTDVAVADGGTGVSAIAAKSVLVANSADTYLALTPAASQSIRINAANTAWEAYTPSSTGGITWTEVTDTSQSAAVNNGYIANNAGLVTVTLPDTAAVGDVVRVVGKGAGGWKVAQNASEIIHFGVSDTTTGTGGSITATHRRDTVELVCCVANTEWVVMSSQGNFTIT